MTFSQLSLEYFFQKKADGKILSGSAFVFRHSQGFPLIRVVSAQTQTTEITTHPSLGSPHFPLPHYQKHYLKPAWLFSAFWLHKHKGESKITSCWIGFADSGHAWVQPKSILFLVKPCNTWPDPAAPPPTQPPNQAKPALLWKSHSTAELKCLKKLNHYRVPALFTDLLGKNKFLRGQICRRIQCWPHCVITDVSKTCWNKISPVMDESENLTCCKPQRGSQHLHSLHCC